MKCLLMLLFVCLATESLAEDASKIESLDIGLTLTLTGNEIFKGSLAIRITPGSNFNENNVTSLNLYFSNTNIRILECKLDNESISAENINGGVKIKNIKHNSEIKLNYEGKYNQEGIEILKIDNNNFYFGFISKEKLKNVTPYPNGIKVNARVHLVHEEPDYLLLDNTDAFTSEKMPLNMISFVGGKLEKLTNGDKNSESVVTYKYKEINISQEALTFATTKMKFWNDLFNVNQVKQIVLPIADVENKFGYAIGVQSDRHFQLDREMMANAFKQYLRILLHGREGKKEGKWIAAGLEIFLRYYAENEDNVSEGENMGHFMVNEMQSRGFEVDGYENSLPLKAYQSPSDSMIYSKGASVYRPLLALCNEFHSALKNLTQSKEELNLDLLISSFKICDEENFLQNFHINNGYPVVHLLDIAKTENDTVLKTKQERFFWSKPVTNETANQKNWILPRIVMVDSSNDTHVVIPEREIKLNGRKNFDWIILNSNRNGFFRVNYDEKMWNAIIKQLEQEHKKISNIDRAQIIDDIFSFARSVHKFETKTPDYEMAFRLFNYLKREENYFPIKSAFNAIDYLNSALFGSSLHSQLTNSVRTLVESLYKTYNLKANATEPLEKLTKLEVSYWACKLGVKDCVETAKKGFNATTLEVDENLEDVKSVVLCTVAKNDDDVWMKIFNKFNNSENGEPVTYIKALGCTSNDNHVHKLMNYALSKNWTVEVVSSILNVYSSKGPVVMKFIKNSVQEIRPDILENLVELSMNRLSNDSLKEFEIIVAKLPENNPVRMVAENAKEALTAWNKEKVNSIQKALKAGESGLKPIALIVIISSFVTIFVNNFSKY